MTALSRLQTLIGAAVVGAALTVGGIATAAPVAIAMKGDGKGKQAPKQETKQVANAKVELKTVTGAVVKGQLNLDWGKDGSVELAAGETKHAVGIKVDRDGEAQQITVTLSYEVDGSPVIEPYTFDMSVGKREVIRVEDGAAIALTVTPKKVKSGQTPAPPPEEPPEEDGDEGGGGGGGKIEVGPGVDDPLGGLE